MAKLIVLVGLPGSGKSHLLKSLPVDARFDDVFASTWRLWELGLAMGRKQSVAISDIIFCYGAHRQRLYERLASSGYEIEWVFFANDAAQCRSNCEKDKTRNWQARLDFIEQAARHYLPPAGSRPVYKL